MESIIFFDGVCSLCNGFVDFIIQRDPKGYFQFCSLQSDFAQKSLKNQNLGLDSVILKEGDQIYNRSQAVLRILFQLGRGWNLLAVFASIFPQFFLNFFYNLIAKNRYRIWGQRSTCRRPSYEEKKRFID